MVYAAFNAEASNMEWRRIGVCFFELISLRRICQSSNRKIELSYIPIFYFYPQPRMSRSRTSSDRAEPVHDSHDS